ncbi:PREDICTED: arrestin domain-containing protein 2-like [Dufourea novaeangliae]|uniref:arrestin domain-containing protein 2-like n=1 Tax=Dufourea novaeangliae TaxID=178035 RepID=UPI000767835E|nr:PREDICTED: arrestin domain-containing protein 2-like [Dufourea novaeangliae]
MPSLEIFRLEFERPSATYSPGEIVKGNIILETTKNKNVRGLYLSARGAASVHWTESGSKTESDGSSTSTSETYSNSQEYFKLKINLLGTSEGDSRIHIPRGYHQYHFEFQLPQNIPSSFEHTYGHVRYTVNGVIDRPWKFDHTCKVAFTVVSVLDLNKYPEKCLGIYDELEKTFCCCCCILNGSLNVTVKVPSSGYVPGQMILTSLEYNNSASSVRIMKISTELEREIKFHATSKTKTEVTNIMASTYSGPFASTGETVLEIRVPPVPPSNLFHCKIIDLNYKLKVVVHVSGPHVKLQKSYLLLIGSVPLYWAPYEQRNIVPDTLTGPATSIPMPLLAAPRTSYDIPSESGTSGRQPPPPGFNLPDPSATPTSCNIPPPSYEECMSGAQHIRDHDESDYVLGADSPFAPKYPVFNYPAPSMIVINSIKLT